MIMALEIFYLTLLGLASVAIAGCAVLVIADLYKGQK